MAEQLYYHYCSFETAEKILEQHKLRLSDVQKSNDKKELKHVKALLNDEEKRMAELNEIYSVYSVSLCKNNNLPNMWNKYADEGKGVALGIDLTEIAFLYENCKITPCDLRRIENISNMINTLATKHNMKDPTSLSERRGINPFLLSVIYKEEEIEDLIERLKKYIEKFDTRKHYRLLILICSIIYKDEEFEKEEEVRIVFPVPKKDRYQIMYSKEELESKAIRDTDNMMLGKVECRYNKEKVEYIDVKIENIFNVIREIVLGPQFEHEEKLRELLDKQGFINTKIKYANE